MTDDEGFDLGEVPEHPEGVATASRRGEHHTMVPHVCDPGENDFPAPSQVLPDELDRLHVGSAPLSGLAIDSGSPPASAACRPPPAGAGDSSHDVHGREAEILSRMTPGRRLAVTTSLIRQTYALEAAALRATDPELRRGREVRGRGTCRGRAAAVGRREIRAVGRWWTCWRGHAARPRTRSRGPAWSARQGPRRGLAAPRCARSASPSRGPPPRREGAGETGWTHGIGTRGSPRHPRGTLPPRQAPAAEAARPLTRRAARSPSPPLSARFGSRGACGRTRRACSRARPWAKGASIAFRTATARSSQGTSRKASATTMSDPAGGGPLRRHHQRARRRAALARRAASGCLRAARSG